MYAGALVYLVGMPLLLGSWRGLMLTPVLMLAVAWRNSDRRLFWLVDQLLRAPNDPLRPSRKLRVFQRFSALSDFVLTSSRC
jgi:protein-S-isoprenylcysteine O-methyltransferase Ste14